MKALQIIILIATTVIAAKKTRPQVQFQAVNSTAIIARWPTSSFSTPACGVKRYLIRYKLLSSETKANTIRVASYERSCTITGLEENQIYTLKFTVINCKNLRFASRWTKVRTKSNLNESKIPGRVRWVRTRTNSNSVIVSWEAPSDNTKVQFYKIGFGEGSPDLKWIYASPDARNITIKSLKSDTQYVISVRAENRKGGSEPVYELVHTKRKGDRFNEVIQTPVQLKATVLNAHAASLKWLDPGLIGSRAARSTDDGFYTVVYRASSSKDYQMINTSKREIVVANLKPFTSYEFKVKAVRGTKSSTFSNTAVNRTYETIPTSSPTSISVVEILSDGVRLTWNEPSAPNGRISGYDILYTTKPHMPESDWTLLNGPGSQTSASLRGLPQNTTYYVKIRVMNGKGPGPYSPIVSFRTRSKHERALADDKSKPEVNSNLTISVKVQHLVTASISWVEHCGSETSPILQYAIRYCLWHENLKDASIIYSRKNLILLTNLVDGATYKFQVRSIIKGEDSEWSAEETFDTRN